MNEEVKSARVRDKRKPGHCWQDNELYDVFQPLIGAIATHVYAVLSRFAYTYRVEDKGVRDIAQESGVSSASVGRALVAMERLGMIVRCRNGGAESSSYDLLDLKEAAISLGAVWNNQRNSYMLPPERVDELRKGGLPAIPQGEIPAESTVSHRDTGVSVRDAGVSVRDAPETLVSHQEHASVLPQRHSSSYRENNNTSRQPPLPPRTRGDMIQNHKPGEEPHQAPPSDDRQYWVERARRRKAEGKPLADWERALLGGVA